MIPHPFPSILSHLPFRRPPKLHCPLTGAQSRVARARLRSSQLHPRGTRGDPPGAPRGEAATAETWLADEHWSKPWENHRKMVI